MAEAPAEPAKEAPKPTSLDGVLRDAVKELGGDGFVELAKLKSHAKIRSFFRSQLFKPPWDEITWALYFQSRSDDWEFEEKTASVREFSALTKQIQEATAARRKASPFPEALFTNILKAGSSSETCFVVSSADASQLSALPVDAHEALFQTLQGPPDLASPIDPTTGQPDPTPIDPAVAMNVIATHTAAQVKVLGALQGALEKKNSKLGQVLEFYGKVCKFGGDVPDPRTVQQKILTLKGLCELCGRLMRKTGLDNASPKSLTMLCQTAPYHIIALAVSLLGDKGDGVEVKTCASMMANIPGAVLEALPRSMLMALAVACTKSTPIAEECVSMVAKACSGTLPTWSMDDICKVLLAVSKAKAGTDSPGVGELYGRACEYLSGKLSEMSAAHLIKVSIVLGKNRDCREFLEALAAEAVNKVEGLASPLLLMLTQGLAPLGGTNASVMKLLETWESLLKDGKVTLDGDKLCTLGKTVHGTGLEKPEFWNQWGKKLAETQKTITDAGWGVFEALCPEGSGPNFESREKLAKTLADKRKPKAEPKKEERKRSRSRYQVPNQKGKDADRRGDRGDRGDRDRRDDRDRRGGDRKRDDSRDRRRR